MKMLIMTITICKELYPNIDFRWGAGWSYSDAGFETDPERLAKFKKVSKEISSKITAYLENPSKFINDVNIAIVKRDNTEQKEREERQSKRMERIKDSRIKYALPDICDLVVKQRGNYKYIADKRMGDGLGKFKHIKNICEIRTSGDINDFDIEKYLKELSTIFSSDDYKNQGSDRMFDSRNYFLKYIIEVSRELEIPLYKDDPMAWGDIYDNEKLKRQSFGKIGEELLKASQRTTSSSLYTLFDIDSFSKESNENYHLVEAMQNNKEIISLDKAPVIGGIDWESLTDVDESAEDYIQYYAKSDKNTTFYRSILNGEDCYVFESMGTINVFMSESSKDNLIKKKSVKKSGKKSSLKV